MNRDVSVLVGCGLGGTSLINAGVMLEPTDEALLKFPETLRASIKGRFDQVRTTLGVNLFPSDITLEKVTSLTAAAAPANVKPAPLAISFKTQVNEFKVQPQQCVLCGSCISGCNHSAKNTVAANYLPGAVNAGAAIF